jgi:hypothetical protein
VIRWIYVHLLRGFGIVLAIGMITALVLAIVSQSR